MAGFDDVAGLDEGAQVVDGLTVEGDAALFDEGFDAAAGAEACGGEVAVETHGGTGGSGHGQ